MKVYFLLIGISLFSCSNRQQLNDGIHADLIETGLAKDSIQKMDIVLDKLNKKNTTFLDYYFHNYYELDKEVGNEIKKVKGEEFVYNANEEYQELFTKLMIEKGNQYLKSLDLTEDEERLALEVYILHLKQKYGSVIDERLKNLNK
ncbi:hypothetical protein [Chryseobacterium potabilaquae]|uniref:Uncharacterized protein n=1 Tax=Chryseobacterium potabilaquae TaxID=2675057 RepID=A0A6N4X6Y0_9FLAO|nr:hypothetical protein [Chryseobacterium potabilaquae]CAA7194991.1 hypothetical protein CHRY9293_01253 [Chryseobacterium potabilaquae]